MRLLLPYDRNAAVDYAARWAKDRNPKFADFSLMGGDCANFISQCLYAGCQRMDRREDIGWYYRSLADRAPAWSGVRFLHEYLLREKQTGLMGEACEEEALEPGDVVFLRGGGRVYHSLLVLSQPPVMVAAHTIDSWMRSLEDYRYADILPVHILGMTNGGGRSA